MFNNIIIAVIMIVIFTTLAVVMIFNIIIAVIMIVIFPTVAAVTIGASVNDDEPFVRGRFVEAEAGQCLLLLPSSGDDDDMHQDDGDDNDDDNNHGDDDDMSPSPAFLRCSPAL